MVGMLEGLVLKALTAASLTAAVIAWIPLDTEAANLAVAAISMVAALVGVWLAWITLRRTCRTDGLKTPKIMADEIALAVRRRWEAEVELRQVNDPYTIPVTWEPADADLVPPWSALCEAACSVGWPEPDRARWASGPADLAGEGGDITRVLRQVPTGRLVLLGEPGAGKTILAVWLVLDLLARRAPGGPVPVLLPLASWIPTREHLWDWLERRLCLEHPELRESAPQGRGVNWARTLWEAGLILPILDGLDEIIGTARSSAIVGLNDALRPGVGVVLTARSTPYRACVNPWNAEQGGMLLSGAAAIELHPLESDVVVRYLRASAGGSAAQARWVRVLDELADPAHPLAHALNTPLMATMARAMYSPRAGEPSAGLPDPSDLLDPSLDSPKAIRYHLFNGFLPSAYRPHPNPALRSPWTLDDVQRWLGFLAVHLEHNLGGTTDLAWWQLRSSTPRAVTGFAAGTVVAVASGVLIGAFRGPMAGFAFGLACGLVFGIPTALATAPDRPIQGMRWSFTKRGLLAGIAIALAVGALFGILGGPLAGLMSGLVGGIGFWFVTGSEPRPLDRAKETGPCTVLGRDRNAFQGIVLAAVLVDGTIGWLASNLTTGTAFWPVGGSFHIVKGLAIALLCAVAIGLACGLWAGVAGGAASGLLAGCVGGVLPWPQGGVGGGLVGGLAVGLPIALSQTAWGGFAVARLWSAVRGRLPWRLISFLAEAHRRGVLRQAGAVYQFRHAELQRYLAERATADTRSPDAIPYGTACQCGPRRLARPTA